MHRRAAGIHWRPSHRSLLRCWLARRLAPVRGRAPPLVYLASPVRYSRFWGLISVAKYFAVGNGLVQQAPPASLRASFEKNVEPVMLPPGPTEAGDKSVFDRVAAETKHNRNRRRRLLAPQAPRPVTAAGYHGHLTLYEFGGECRQSVVCPFAQRYSIAMFLSRLAPSG